MGKYAVGRKARKQFINANWRKARGPLGKLLYAGGRIGSAVLGDIAGGLPGAYIFSNMYKDGYYSKYVPQFKRALRSRITWRRKGTKPWVPGVGSNPPRNVIGVNPIPGAKEGKKKYRMVRFSAHKRGIKRRFSFK